MYKIIAHFLKNILDPSHFFMKYNHVANMQHRTYCTRDIHIGTRHTELFPFKVKNQRFAETGRLFWLTNSALIFEPKCGRGGCGVSANEHSCAHGAQINFRGLTTYLTYVKKCVTLIFQKYQK
jgi:hypothetical protein